MKKLFTFIAVALVAMIASAATVETQKFLWNNATCAEDYVAEVGTIEQKNGTDNRLNYANTALEIAYKTICLNGKKGNMNDEDGTNNACYMIVTLTEPLAVGDIIKMTAYRNKNESGKGASAYLLFDNEASVVIGGSDGLDFVNLNAAGETPEATAPNTIEYVVTDAEAGATSFKMTREKASTNLFVTALEVVNFKEVAEGLEPIITKSTIGLTRAMDSATKTAGQIQPMEIAGIEAEMTYGEKTLGELEAGKENTRTVLWHGVSGYAVAENEGVCTITNKDESLNEEAYFGVKFEVPTGKVASVNNLVAGYLYDKATKWKVQILNNGEVVYDTNDLKLDNYNNGGGRCVGDSINITDEGVSGLSAAYKEKYQGEETEETVLKNKISWTEGNYLTEAVDNLEGTVEIKLYYWNNGQTFVVKDLFADVTVAAQPLEPIVTENTIGLTRAMDPATKKAGQIQRIEIAGIEAEMTCGNKTFDELEAGKDNTRTVLWHGVSGYAVAENECVCTITNKDESLNEEAYFGVKFEVPAGKVASINNLVAGYLYDKATKWKVQILNNGEVVYDTNDLKLDNYNNGGGRCVGDSINITDEGVSGLSAAYKEKYQGEDTEETVLKNKISWIEGNYLTEAVKNLKGAVEVKLYYWNNGQTFVIKDLYVNAVIDYTDGISNVAAVPFANGAIFNLAGQKVSSNYKGIIIVDGKKFLNK